MLFAFHVCPCATPLGTSRRGTLYFVYVLARNDLPPLLQHSDELIHALGYRLSIKANRIKIGVVAEEKPTLKKDHFINSVFWLYMLLVRFFHK